MVQRLSSALVKHRGHTLSEFLDREVVHSSDFSSLQEWAAYPAKHKVLSGGTYTLSSTLEVKCNKLTTDGLVTINCTDSFVAMHFGSTERVLLTTLSDAVSANLTSLTVNGVQAGDVLCFYNPTDYSWSSYRNYYRAGEFVKVVRYEGGIAYFSGGLAASYPPGTQVYKLTTVQVDVHGHYRFNFPKYDRNAMAMQFEQVSDSNFDGLQVDSYSAPYAAQFKRCFNLSGDGMSLTQQSESTAFGLEYGCYLCNCQGVVFNGVFSAERHACTMTGNDEICGIVNRFNYINRSGGRILTTGQGAVAAADFHSNCEHCGYGGYIQGLSLSGVNNDVSGAHIDPIPNNPNWPSVLATDLKGIGHNLSNIKVVGRGDPSVVNRGCIDFGGNSNAFAAGCTVPGTLNLSGAVIDSPAQVLIEIRNRGSMAAHKINLNGVTANAEQGKLALRIAPLGSGIAPTDVMMSGFSLSDGVLTQINKIGEVKVHGLSVEGQISGTILSGTQSVEVVLSLPSWSPGVPKFTDLVRIGTVPQNTARFDGTVRDYNAQRVRFILHTTTPDNVTGDTQLTFNYMVKW